MKPRIFLRTVLPLVVLILGGGALYLLKITRADATKGAREHTGTLVEVMKVDAGTHAVKLRAQGTVQPAEEVVIHPEVGGRVIWQSDELVPGGHFAKGDPLVRVDRRDYLLALEAQRAELSRAELALEQEKARQRIAAKEWKAFGGAETGTEGQALALRQPHMKTAEVGLSAAESSLQRARLNLGRTHLKAPFDAIVMQEQVEIGQLVGPQTALARLVGTSRFWVQVSVPLSALASVELPSETGPGAATRVIQDVDGVTIERVGRIERMLPDLDPAGGMARLLVAIDDPFSRSAASNEPPLLLGAYVRVEIDARPIENAFALPTATLREGDKVYAMDGEDRLAVLEPEIVWRDGDQVLVRGDLGGKRIVRSRIANPVSGMQLRVAEKGGKRKGGKGGKGGKGKDKGAKRDRD